MEKPNKKRPKTAVIITYTNGQALIQRLDKLSRQLDDVQKKLPDKRPSYFPRGYF